MKSSLQICAVKFGLAGWGGVWSTDDEMPPVIVMLSLNVWDERDSSYIKRAP